MTDPFAECAQDYAVYRPAYPSDLYALLRMKYRLADGARVLDAGCGTGIVTTELAARWWKPIGIDTSARMLGQARRSLAQQAEQAPLARARAEQLPFKDGLFDLVTCAQAFHWMAPAPTLAEFSRVLKPNAALAVIFNERRYEEEGFSRDFEALIMKHIPSFDPDFLRRPWDRQISASGLFRLVQYFRFDWEWPRSAEELAGYVSSISYLRNTLGDLAWPTFLEELENLVPRHANQNGEAVLKMRTDLWVCKRK